MGHPALEAQQGGGTMPRQISGQNPAGNPDGNPPPPPIEPTIEHRVVTLEAKSHSHVKEENPESLASAVKLGEIWLIGINAALLITTIVIAWIYYHQLQQMVKTTTATKEAITDSDRNFRIDERAWIEIQVPNIDFRRETIGKIFVVPIEIINTGKTPARNIQIKGVVSIVRNRSGLVDLPSGDITHGYSLMRIGIMQPNQSIKDWSLAALDTDGVSKPVTTTQAIRDHVMDASYSVVVHGRVIYEDAFGGEHWLTFCHNSNGLIGGSPQCFEYNNFDRDEIK
jgi:hypothetical protein